MDYLVSEKFHNQYGELCDHIVIVTLKDGQTIEGNFADEFYDEASILISALGADVLTIKISDIEKMELSDRD